MEEVFIAIMEQIAQEMPELSLIDEDYGQLEMGAEEDQYPVTFPCVLIGNTSRCSVCNARTTLRRWYARKAARMPCHITSRSMK